MLAMLAGSVACKKDTPAGDAGANTGNSTKSAELNGFSGQLERTERNFRVRITEVSRGESNLKITYSIDKLEGLGEAKNDFTIYFSAEYEDGGIISVSTTIFSLEFERLTTKVGSSYLDLEKGRKLKKNSLKIEFKFRE